MKEDFPQAHSGTNINSTSKCASICCAEKGPPAGGSSNKDSCVGSLRRLKFADLNDSPRKVILEEPAGCDRRPKFCELPPHIVQHLPASRPQEDQHATLHFQ